MNKIKLNKKYDKPLLKTLNLMIKYIKSKQKGKDESEKYYNKIKEIFK